MSTVHKCRFAVLTNYLVIKTIMLQLYKKATSFKNSTTKYQKHIILRSAVQ